MALVRTGRGRVVAALCAWLLASGAAWGQTVPQGFAVRRLTTTGLTSPTAMALRPDGSLLIAQKAGALRLFKNGSLQATAVYTFPGVISGGEEGLIGLCLDPGHATNGYVYARVTRQTGGGIVRITMDGDAMVAGSETLIFPIPAPVSSIHQGGGVHFGLGGKLLFTVGESCGNEQGLTDLCGKLMRVGATGAPCTDNPFYATLTGDLRATYCYGLRNPFTFAVKPGDDSVVLINDVGSAFEEIDVAQAGANYGYPTTSGFFSQAMYPQFTQPLYAYPTSGSAITGGVFYLPAQPQFPSGYRGKYFFGDYVDDWVRTIDPAGGVAQEFGTGFTDAVGYELTPDGRLLVLGQTGGLWEVTYTLGACCTGTACVVTTQALCAGGAFGGVATACGVVGDGGACCKADYNGQGGADLLDIFAFLADWFALSPKADFDGRNGTDLGDIFAFLGAWFAGCS